MCKCMMHEPKARLARGTRLDSTLRARAGASRLGLGVARVGSHREADSVTWSRAGKREGEPGGRGHVDAPASPAPPRATSERTGRAPPRPRAPACRARPRQRPPSPIIDIPRRLSLTHTSHPTLNAQMTTTGSDRLSDFSLYVFVFLFLSFEIEPRLLPPSVLQHNNLISNSNPTRPNILHRNFSFCFFFAYVVRARLSKSKS